MEILQAFFRRINVSASKPVSPNSLFSEHLSKSLLVKSSWSLWPLQLRIGFIVSIINRWLSCILLFFSSLTFKCKPTLTTTSSIFLVCRVKVNQRKGSLDTSLMENAYPIVLWFHPKLPVVKLRLRASKHSEVLAWVCYRYCSNYILE